MGSIWSLKDHVEASAAAAQRRRKLRPVVLTIGSVQKPLDKELWSF